MHFLSPASPYEITATDDDQHWFTGDRDDFLRRIFNRALVYILFLEHSKKVR